MITTKMISREEAEQYWPVSFIGREITVPTPRICIINDDWVFNLIKSPKKGWFKMFFKKRKELERELIELRRNFHRLCETVSTIKCDLTLAHLNVEILSILSGNILYKKFNPGWEASANREEMKEEGYVFEGCVSKGSVEIWVKRGKANG